MAKKSSIFDVVKGITQKKGTKDKEIEKYERILQQQPDDRNALNALGDLYAKRGDTDKACERYLRVGELYAKDGFTLKAIAVYKKAQRAKPNLVSTYLNLAGLYVQKGLIGEAKSNYLTVAISISVRSSPPSRIWWYSTSRSLPPSPLSCCRRRIAQSPYIDSLLRPNGWNSPRENASRGGAMWTDPFRHLIRQCPMPSPRTSRYPP